MIQFVRKVKRCGLWADMGLGKTSSVLIALIGMKLLGEIDPRYPILVIGPARVACDTWPDEIAKWAQFENLTLISLSGSPAERLKKLKLKADIFTISYELLPWLVSYWLAKWPYRVVIADELDRLKGFREQKGGVKLKSEKSGASGERAFALGRVAHTGVDRWINLGGTPAPAGLKDLWGSTWFLDRGARLGSTFTDFKKRWFRLRWSGKGIEPLPYAHEQIHAALHDICLTVDPKDYFDLKTPRVNRIGVKLPPRARNLYERLQKDLFIELESGAEIDVLSAMGLANKCMQMANGAMYVEGSGYEEVHRAKIEALESILHEAAGMPLLVQYAFKSDKERILKSFPGAVDISTKRGLAAFKAGDAGMGVAHPDSMGHGIDGLQYVTNQIARFGHIWKSGPTAQMLARIGPMRQFQAGFEREVLIHDIVARDTVDEAILQHHKRNGRTQGALMDYMNRRRRDRSPDLLA